MRAIWKGSIAFGLVHIPVYLYPATESQSISSNLLHKKDHSRSFAAVESGLQWATYPQSPDSGPGPLLRRSEPVPGILAADRSGAIVDKSERRRVGNVHRGTGDCAECFCLRHSRGLLKFL